jgi:tetraacyldisaccharide 4'-kinase
MTRTLERHFHDTVSGRRRTIGSALQRAILHGLSLPYGAAMRVRNGCYQRGLLTTHGVDVPVISVGNLTMGGTGKTPIVHWICDRLRARGNTPAVLMRGYRAESGRKGDEQRLLEEHELIVHADPDRVRGARELLRRHPSVDRIVLDDGFQHRRLRRDLDLVVIDATNPFGYGHVFPRGTLREPVSGLRRADAVIINRSSLVEPSALREIESRVASIKPQCPVFHGDTVHEGLLDEHGDLLPMARLRHTPYLLACAIGNPDALIEQLSQLAGPREVFAYRDHHAFTSRDLEDLRQSAVGLGAEAIVVTEKDWVKLRALSQADATPIAIWRIKTSVKLDENLLSLLP